jgi:hypothetical protein
VPRSSVTGAMLGFRWPRSRSRVPSLLQSCSASLRCDHRRSYRHHERPGSTTSWQERREICVLTTAPHPRFPAARPLRAPIQAESVVRSAGGRQSDRNRPALARKGVPYGESRFNGLFGKFRRSCTCRFASFSRADTIVNQPGEMITDSSLLARVSLR